MIGTGRRWFPVMASVSAVAAVMLLGVPGTASGQGTELTIIQDVGYRSVAGTELTLDAYLPVGPGPHPAVIVIPGGKWVEGTKEDNTWLPVDLANLGYAAFPVNYRPATEAPFPAAIEDVQAAVRFIRERATRFDIDPEQFGAIGASAGGHLAALLATWGEGTTDSGARVRVAVSWSGPMDLERLLHHPRADFRSVVRTFLGCSASEPCLDQAREASPIDHLDPSDGAIYLGNGTEEIIPLEQATVMIAALERNGVPNQLVQTIGHDHGFGAVHNDKFFSPAMAFLGTSIGGDGTTVPSPSAGSGKAGSSPQPSAAPSVSGQKGGDDEPTSGSTDTPWWVLAITATAVMAALLSLVVSITLFRRLRSAGPPSHGPAGPPEGGDGRDGTKRSLAGRGTDSAE